FICRMLAGSVKSVINGAECRPTGRHAPFKRKGVHSMHMKMKRKTFEEAKEILRIAAQAYKDNYINKNVLFVAIRDEVISLYEVSFFAKNFMHLTGNTKPMSSKYFFNLAKNGSLKKSDFTFANDGTTDMKLDVLLPLMNILYNAQMIGDYNNLHEWVVTDKMVGTVTIAMGFKKDEEANCNVPCTALKTDVRTVSLKPVLPIKTILRKDRSEKLYSEVTRFAKGVTSDQLALMVELAEIVDFEKLKSTKA
ncbi:MAG: PBECR4 domain-containing protein, partial [Oscillospiraceae bacterium]|nr:PBECR4 domain-containing protein [Oscillospiraceae bacterium]